jgi:hypothetical protein
MSTAKEDPVGQAKKIDILLEEYRTLRMEVNSLMGWAFQVGAIGAGVVTWALAQATLNGFRLLAAISLIVVIVAIIWIIGGYSVARAATRLRGLEQEINSRAGSYLLLWEQLYSPARSGKWYTMMFPFLKVRDPSKLAPLVSFDTEPTSKRGEI